MESNAAVKEPMVKPPQAAKALGVSLQTIHNWSKDGTIRCMRIQGRQRATVRIPQSEIDRLSRATVTRPTPPTPKASLSSSKRRRRKR